MSQTNKNGDREKERACEMGERDGESGTLPSISVFRCLVWILCATVCHAVDGVGSSLCDVM